MSNLEVQWIKKPSESETVRLSLDWWAGGPNECNLHILDGFFRKLGWACGLGKGAGVAKSLPIGILSVSVWDNCPNQITANE